MSGMQRKYIQKRVEQALHVVELRGHARKRVAQLSLGQQQRAALARAVVGSPAILLADEPTGNLDSRLSADIMTLFAHFARGGASVVVVTHDLALIRTMKQPCLILKEGKVHKFMDADDSHRISETDLV